MMDGWMDVKLSVVTCWKVVVVVVVVVGGERRRLSSYGCS